MSIEAIAFAKQMDLGAAENAQARLLVYVIAENTFNDTFVCRLCQEQLAYEAGRVSDRTIRRHLDALEEARAIIRPRAQRRAGGGHMLADVIRLRGFKRWYLRDHGARQKLSSPADKLSGGGAAAKRATGGQSVRRPPDTCCPPAAGQQVSGAYKDTRTSKPVLTDARDARSEDSDFGLEGKGVRDRLRQIIGGPKFGAWLADMAFTLDGDLVIATSPAKFKAEWAERHFAEKILAACKAEWPAARTVAIRHAAALTPADPAAPGRLAVVGASDAHPQPRLAAEPAAEEPQGGTP